MFCFKDTNEATRDFEVPNQDVRLYQRTSETYTAYDVAWQALHAAAAAACRGSTPTGGSGAIVNSVLTRNSRGPKSCTQLCADTNYTIHCDAEVSVYGKAGKATTNGQLVGLFYNYDCDTGTWTWGGEEAKAAEEEIMGFNEGAFSFCCCRK